jgi:hypothetical protein
VIQALNNVEVITLFVDALGPVKAFYKRSSVCRWSSRIRSPPSSRFGAS